MAIDLFSVTVLSIPRVLLVAAAVCAQWGYRISTGFSFKFFLEKGLKIHFFGFSPFGNGLKIYIYF